MEDNEVKCMSVKEFREMGGLHEINRQFLHPLGLAIEVSIDDNGDEKFGRIWDYRDDPEGILFDKIDEEKKNSFKKFQEKKHEERISKLGFIIQDSDEGK